MNTFTNHTTDLAAAALSVAGPARGLWTAGSMNTLSLAESRLR